MIEVIPAIIKHCMNNSAVVTAFSTRIWGNKVPELPGGGAQPFPHAVMREITTSNNYAHVGNVGRVVMVQIDVYDDANNEARANASSELIRALFDGYKGVIGGTLNAGMVTARRVSGIWESELRNYWRVLEITISTND